MIKAIVAGGAGRMGTRIIHMIKDDPEIELTGVFEHPEHSSVGKDAGEVAGMHRVGITISPSLEEIIDKGDVIIDFTTPESTLNNVRQAVKKGKSMVIGTTGIEGDALKEIKSLCSQIRCVMAPNMSVGVNVMFKIAHEMAKILGRDYDMEILEIHHRMKKDAPSGTAMRLARILAEAVDRDLEQVAVYERKGMIGKRTDEEIGIQTFRAGDIAGEHFVLFAGPGERLELIHRAHSRDNFARGALKAVKWVINQSPGLYDMQDVLGLR